jgi:hypothetical protein
LIVEMKWDGGGSGPRPKAGLGIVDVEHSDSVTTVTVYFLRSLWLQFTTELACYFLKQAGENKTFRIFLIFYSTYRL